MNEIVDLVAIVVVLAFLVLGILRGLLREVLVLLGGIILGVLLSGIWVDAWGAGLATDVQGRYRLIGLFAIVVLIGYGSSLFLPNERPNWRQRLAGAGVGILNGVLLLAFTFQYVQVYLLGSKADSALEKGIISRVLIHWLPWVLLGIAALVVLAVAIAAIIKLFHFFARLTQPPEAAPAPAVLQPAAAAVGQVPFNAMPLAPTPVPAPAVTPSETPPANAPTISCPNCNSTIPAESVYCPNCGKILK